MHKLEVRAKSSMKLVSETGSKLDYSWSKNSGFIQMLETLIITAIVYGYGHQIKEFIDKKITEFESKK